MGARYWFGILTLMSVLVVSSAVAEPLHDAAKNGDVDRVERLIAQGADVNAADSNGFTPLHRAALSGHKAVAELLIANGADINAKGNLGGTPLHWATGSAVVELLLAQDADVHAKDHHGHTPLHMAAQFGKKAVVELLLAQGADVHAKDHHGHTPLDAALGVGYTLVANLLGANIEIKQPPSGFLKELSRAKVIIIHCAWAGVANSFDAKYRLRVEEKGFGGSSGPVSSGRVSGKQTETLSLLTIPFDAAQAFFAALAQSPLVEGQYRPFFVWTDDYPEIEIEIKLESQTVRYFTESQGRGHVPWGATISGVNYVIGSDAPARALATLSKYGLHCDFGPFGSGGLSRPD